MAIVRDRDGMELGTMDSGFGASIFFASFAKALVDTICSASEMGEDKYK